MPTPSASVRARLWPVAGVVIILAIAAPLAFAGRTTTSHRAAYHLRLAPHVVKPANNAPVGQVFGGASSQGWPIAIEVSKDGRQVVRALAGIELKCTSGDSMRIPDAYVKVPLSAKGKFSASFGPMQIGTTPEGQKVMGQGSAAGSRNAAATKMKGTWKLTTTFIDPAGATVDTCDSGNVNWTAKQ